MRGLFVSTIDIRGQAAQIAFGEGSFMKNLSLETTPQLVVDSIIGANALGLSFRP
jgi:hypothetical protein